MNRSSRLAVLLALLTFGAAACSRSEAAGSGTSATPPAATGSPAAQAARPRLVFFMNPNGRPCQMQDAILHEMGGELADRAEVVYYRTTTQADLPRFQQYGVRSLPLLVLTDSSGHEIRRATPGIQSPPQVLQLLAP